MKRISRFRKPIAALLLCVLITELTIPGVAYALTSGPAQPEMKGFQPAGAADMVDLFSGDFSYNIPLLDVGGYPVNLSYQSGAGMDDEASWTGYGWNVNVGSLNRQLRGIPDDFNGSDIQEREMNTKDHVTKGGRFSVTLDLLGVPVNKIKRKARRKRLNLSSLTVSAGVQIDNYRGVGAEFGANIGLSLSDFSADDKTANLKDTGVAKALGGVGLNLSSMDGAGVNVNANILRKNYERNEKSYSLTKSIGFGYNSRAGLTGMTLSSSFSATKQKEWKGKSVTVKDFENGSSSTISFNGETYTPSIDHPTTNQSYSFTLNLGPEVFIALPAMGVTGFYSKQSLRQRTRKSGAYGYLNSEKGADDENALMDFNREKDIPYSAQVNYLPVPIPTYDLFYASSQAGGGQYRLYRGSSGILFDQKTGNSSISGSLGIEIGAGAYFDVGADIYVQDIAATTKKWRDRNNFIGKGDFKGKTPTSPLYEPAYFKRIGEPVPNDKTYTAKIKGTTPVAVHLPVNKINPLNGAETSSNLRTKSSPNGESTSVLQREQREVRNNAFSYLTAAEAVNHALDKKIKDYHPDSVPLNSCTPAGVRNSFNRVGSYRKAHHFSEITVTGDDGKRSVYGIPVYNTYQEEVSFSVTQNLAQRNSGLIRYADGLDNSISNNKGLENYFSKEKTPAYTTSFLLTGILSPDYVDKTGNGISDDDAGTAVKFNYSKVGQPYMWRTPIALGRDTANYNEGFLSDPRDDKANYVYGEKEAWYLHSIESKTMVAHFITADRQDALGVINSRGEINSSTRLKYLKEIRLYSKSDLLQHGGPTKTIPIKTVHFEYDYSVCRGLPNSVGQTGKLTLKKVYFTFGSNNKGRLNPYKFSYDTTFNFYNYRQYDRWGNFKNSAENPGGLNNSEYPYTLQDSALTSSFVSSGQLRQIDLPSGGTIAVTYESDDYAYVQDKRASQMCKVAGINSQGSSTGLINADYLLAELPVSVSSRQEMIERYFEGVENLYYKCLLDLDAKGHKEFVPGYARIIGKPELIGSNIAKIKIEKIGGINTIAKSGWQFLRMNLPRYAYPGSDNLDDGGSDLKKTIKALVTAFGTIKELITGFDKRAKDRKFSDKVELSKSWVRLCSPAWKKYGGGSRVKRIDMSDDWAAMSGASGAKTATYSQVYDYTTKDLKGKIISSGVASYEPSLGNDENPFRQPIRYKQDQFLGLDNFYYIEEPFGEAFFPAASVGYSRVAVKSIGSGDQPGVNRTGVSVSEFYTAKDYPVKIDILSLQKRKPIDSKIFKLIGGVSYDMVGLSQGYSIELNDMHGKPKSVNTYNKSGQNISSIEYFYKSESKLTNTKTLNNDVKVIGADGVVSDGSIGLDIEMFTDMRQQTTDNIGVSVKVSGGSGALLFFPLPFFFPGIGVNYDKRSYRASSTVKLVNRFGILSQVRKVENGSSITTENMLWDAKTGNVLLTKTQNEYDDPVYSFSYPAHWVYEGMGPAYQNLGTVLSNFNTGPNGQILNSTYNNLLFPGDELIDVVSAQKYWVINSPIADIYQKRLIDKDGYLRTVNAATVKLLRSGRRNMASAGIATITSLANPVVNNKLDVTQLTKILTANAVVFNEIWTPPDVQRCNICPGGYTIYPDSTKCYRPVVRYPIPATTSNSDWFCQRKDSTYSVAGTFIYSKYNRNGTYDSIQPLQIIDTNSFWRNTLNDTVHGPLNRTGTWICGVDSTTNQWLGYTTRVSIPRTDTFYIGVGGNNRVQVIVDGDTVLSQDMHAMGSQEPFPGFWSDTNVVYKAWHVYPIILQAGIRFINIQGWNEYGKAVFGAEIYDNTEEELTEAINYPDHLRVVFSSSSFRSRTFTDGVYTPYICSSGIMDSITYGFIGCKDTLFSDINDDYDDAIVNPYYTGMLGNWRMQSQLAYHVARENIKDNVAVFGNTNVRIAGAYSQFNPFWSYNDVSQRWNKNITNDIRWIAANEVTNFNGKGSEVENRDALNRYSAALFGYLESLPTAVASNARYREIGYDGIEDYAFTVDCANNNCSSGHFTFKGAVNNSSVKISNKYAHTGRHSLEVNGEAKLVKQSVTPTDSALFSFDNGRYLLQPSSVPDGFVPIPGRKYLMSFWVKDNNPRDPSTSVNVRVNGNNLVSNAAKWPIVEGWKRVEVQFAVPVPALNFTIQLQSGGGTVYFDDIRVHPVDGQLKSFAYDPSSQRLWAELDENNFATFYEYDDEGILIRVKKETERGIMTIKETRSSYRKNQ